MAALATIPDLEAVIGRVVTVDEQPRAERLLELASAAVRRETGQTFDLVTSDIVTVRPVGKVARLPQRPVTNVIEIVDDGQVVSPDVYEWTSQGVITRTPLVDWGDVTGSTRWVGPLTVTYDHGYDTVPDDVAGIVCDAAAARLSNPDRVRQESIGSYSVTYPTAENVALSTAQKRALSAYSAMSAVRTIPLSF